MRTRMDEDRSSSEQRRRREGLYSSLKSLTANVLDIVRTRLELLGNEVEAEKSRVLSILFFSFFAIGMLLIGLVLAVCLAVACFWEDRIVVLAVSTGMFLLLGLIMLGRAKSLARRPSSIFSASLAELGEDTRLLRTTSRNEEAGS